MQSTPSFPLLPVLLWRVVIAAERVLSMNQIELFNIYAECKQIIYAKRNCFKLSSLII